jgi:hypothetical protein
MFSQVNGNNWFPQVIVPNHRMDGIGLLVVMAFVLITLAIVSNSCFPKLSKEGFEPSFTMPKVGPPPQSVTGKKDPTGYTSVTDLPSAPINSLAETNSRPYQDPALEKASRQMLNELKQDMDGFASFEMPHLEGKSDPAVALPLTRFKGDYQRVKDELLVLAQNPGLQPQLSIQDVETAGANLRFLQRTYRLYANNKMVPAPRADLSKVGMSDEGFTNPGDEPITPDQLALLSQKLAVEIVRLQASGTTDPVLQARASMFTKMRQTVDDLNTRVKNGTLPAKDIPIKVSDYEKFLPALGDSSAGIGGLLSKSGYSSLSSLFNAYDAGDASGSDIAAALFETYADELLKGLSYKIDVSYVSPNEVAKKQAEATAWDAQRAIRIAGAGNAVDTGHPLTQTGSRGAFESQIRQMDLAGFQGQDPLDTLGSANESGPIRPPTEAATKIGKFDWKARSDAICLNVARAGLNPAEFGCMPKASEVSPDYSWRGHTKMVCSRLATHSDPATPEQMGCPPVSWKGWKQ